MTARRRLIRHRVTAATRVTCTRKTTPVLQSVKANASHMIRCEIEVDRLDQLAEVLDLGVDF